MAIPTEQTVYRLTEIIDYQAIKKFQEPLSTDLSNNEVLVKIKAVSLNYRDLVVASGHYPLPVVKNVIPCSDASGEVVKVGALVRDLHVGDHVVANFNPEHLYGDTNKYGAPLGAIDDGVLAQYRVFPSYAVNKIPKDSHLTHEEASVLVCAGVTVWNALYGSGKPFIAGQSVLMLGTGGVSITALILAKAAGAVTIITSSSDEKLRYVQEKYGVDHVVNYKTHPDWEKKVLEITNGEGVDFVIENGGNGTIAKSIQSVRKGGQICIIGFLTRPESIPDVIMGLLNKGASARGINAGSKQLAEELIRFVHAKKLHMPVEKVYGFSEEEDIHAAYANVQSQTQVGKTIIKLE